MKTVKLPVRLKHLEFCFRFMIEYGIPFPVWIWKGLLMWLGFKVKVGEPK